VSLGILSRQRGSGSYVKSEELAIEQWEKINSEHQSRNATRTDVYKICFLLSIRTQETLENSFHFATFLGANREAMRLNCRLEVMDFPETLSCKEVESLLLKRQIDGFLIPRSDVIPNAIVQKFKLPTVYCGASFFFHDHDYILSDDAEGGKQATEYLMRLGHKRIAFVDYVDFNPGFKFRRHGYLMTYEHKKIPVAHDMIFTYRGPDSINDLIIEKMSNDEYDSICFTTWHLYSEDEYLHFWETKINNVGLIDPHTRVIKRNKRFERLFADGSHPIINPTEKTYCTNGAFHFHLKYYKLSPYPNYALHFLPERITEKDLHHYIKKLSFKLPDEVKNALQKINWTKYDKLDTNYYKYYESERKLSASAEENLIHPKDKLL